MKGIFIVVVVTFGCGLVAGKYLFREANASLGQCLDPSVSISQIPEEYLAPLAPAELIVPAKTQFQCDGRKHCSQMTSKAEAQFFLANCPNTEMDGDFDGDACERQFER